MPRIISKDRLNHFDRGNGEVRRASPAVFARRAAKPFYALPEQLHPASSYGRLRFLTFTQCGSGVRLALRIESGSAHKSSPSPACMCELKAASVGSLRQINTASSNLYKLRQYRAVCRTDHFGYEAGTPRHTGPRFFCASCCRLIFPVRATHGGLQRIIRQRSVSAFASSARSAHPDVAFLVDG